MGVRRLRSDESGAVRIVFGDGIEVQEHRRERARYWQDLPRLDEATRTAPAQEGGTD
jgi:hypothetical protein